MSQYVPTKAAGLSRVRTGFERVVAHRVTMPFAYTAEEDGIITNIDEKLSLLTVKYKSNGETYVLKYGQEYSNNGGGGFYVTQNIELNDLKIGKKFKRGDVLLYNRDYFTKDIYSNQVDLNTGLFANVSLIEKDTTMEDSCIISKKLAEGLESYPVQLRTITLEKKTNIHSIVTVGTEVKSADSLLVFDESDLPEEYAANPDLVDLIETLNRATPKSKYNGKIVKIEAYYRGDLTDMSETLSKVVRVANKDDKARLNKAKGSDNEADHYKAGSIAGDRLGTITMTDETVVLKFYIQQTLGNEIGDKIVFGGSLKSVVGETFEKPMETEDGETVDAIIAFSSAQNRMISSVVTIGIANRILEHVENNILDMYFEE